MGSKRTDSKSAKARGALKKRRRKRAEHREATREVRERINEKMREAEHPGWGKQDVLAYVW